MLATARPAVRLVVLSAVLSAATAGCAVSLPGSGDDEPGSGAASPTEPARTEACAEVRAGIDAFNEGDFTETVARFEAALPLAEEHAEQEDSERADLLLEAVRWYAELPPEDYPRASRSSEDFARYKAITLAQCVVDEPGEGESSDGVTV